MGFQHHAGSESPTQFTEHSGIKSATEQASIKRNNTNEMLPENSSGKDDEAIKMIWLDRARNRFRFYQHCQTYTGSFCVFGPVLSSPAHGPTYLAMGQVEIEIVFVL
jgi:hypothetical protein